MAALTALGVTCDEDGNPGDGIAAAGSVGSGHAREYIVSIGSDGSIHSPEDILAQWVSLAEEELRTKAEED